MFVKNPKRAQNIGIMDHSPYSPDLEPNDFLFLRIKDKLLGLRFTSVKEAVLTVQNQIKNLRPEYRRKSIDCGGEYFKNKCFFVL